MQVEPKLRDRTVTMNGCSKAYAMTGWRIGFAGAPLALIKAMDKLQSQSTSNTSSISQAAAVEALTGPQEFIGEMVAVYKQRRDLVVDMLNAGARHQLPQAGGRVLRVPIRAWLHRQDHGEGPPITDRRDFVLALLDEEGVAAVHGAAFMYPGHFRISYATDTESLREACTRIQRFLRGDELRRCRPSPAARLGRVKPAATVQMTIKARALRAEGIDVIQLTIGEPDFATPPHAIEAAHQAALRGETKYPAAGRHPALKEAVQRKFKRDRASITRSTRSWSPMAASR